MADGPQPCPVCASSAWQECGVDTFSRGSTQGLNDYEKLRRRVLFEVWHPGSDSVELRTVLCRECGFVSTAPRPSTELVDAKYRFLADEEPSVGGSAFSELGRRMDERRAVRTKQAVEAHMRLAGASVLDFGGGNGKLLQPFIDAGARCFLVDYNRDPIAGVERLGATLDELPDHLRFDAVVCSHVLEHVADPAETLRGLQGHIAEGGVLYAEVPVEVWRGIPVSRDPVTHVNFFTLGSLEQLFVRSGYGIRESREFLGSYAEVVIEVAAVVADRGEGTARVADPAGAAASRLAPGPGQWLRHAAVLVDRVARQAVAIARGGGIAPAVRALLGRVGARMARVGGTRG